MSDFKHKPNAGSFFSNDRKEKDEQPDFTGSALIGGKEYWVSAWHQSPKAGGEKYFSLAFKPKEKKKE